MSDMAFRRIPKADVIRLLTESRAREVDLTAKCREMGDTLRKLEEDFARKTSDLELSMRRELELRKGNESYINQRTEALKSAEYERTSNITLRRELDFEKKRNSDLEQRIADMRLMVDVVKTVASR